MTITKIEITKLDKDDYNLLISYNNGQKVVNITLDNERLGWLYLEVNTEYHKSVSE